MITPPRIRMKEMRQRNKDKGLVEVCYWSKPEHRATIQAFIKQINKDDNLEPKK